MSGGRIRVREATPADAAAIARVHVDTWRSAYRGIVPQSHLDQLSYEARTRRWQTMRQDPQAGVGTFVAETAEARIVGFAGGGPERGADPAARGELYAIYVLAEHQRSGVGRALTLAVVERLGAAGFSSMVVWALADNPSRRFYERLGGEPAGSRDIEIGGLVLRETAYGWHDMTALRRACAGPVPAPSPAPATHPGPQPAP